MHVNVCVKGLPESSKLRRLASLKLNHALARLTHLVTAASVQLLDINGPKRGGVDKLCRVVLRLRNDTVVVVEDLGSDIAHVIDRVADRLHQSVSRQLGRIKHIDRSSVRQNTLVIAEA